MDSSTVLRFNRPSLADRRGEARLLVWGATAQWLVVDAELAAFLELFDGRRTLRQVVRRHARRWRREQRAVEAETAELLDDLRGRGILAPPGRRPPVPPEEPVSIANVTVNLTNRCNLRCRWCYNAGRATPELDVERLMQAVEQGRALLEPGATFIVLGGEPLIDPDRLLAAVDRAADIFAAPTLISTNGTLLDDDVVRRLARRRVEVQVSIDSHLARRHDAIRGRGSFDRATAGLRRLVHAGVHAIVSMVYSRDNLQDMEPLLDLARELGADEARFIPMRTIGRGLELADRRPDQLEALEHLLEILERRPELRRLLARDYFSIFMTVCRYSAPRTSCGVGRRVLFIDADGAVYPCPNHVAPELRCGDVTESTLEQIVRDSPVMRAVRARYRVEGYPVCRTCAFRHWCAGDCRGEVLAVTGDPLAPSPHCEELQQLFLRMLWLAAEDDPRLGTRPTLPHGQATADAFRG